MTNPAAFSAAGLAARWGCSQRHIYKMVEDGGLQSFRLGKLIRIAAGEVARVEACGSSYTGENTMPSGERLGKQSGSRFEPMIVRSRIDD